MKFRPCIDIHNGKVKQIVGGSLTDTGDWAQTNFVAERPAQWFASRYREDGLTGGHVILLNPPASRYFAKTRHQAMEALSAFPGGLQISIISGVAIGLGIADIFLFSTSIPPYNKSNSDI